MRYFWALIAIMIVPLASAATITGTVYDLGLQPVPGAVVQINTTTPQTVVATDGDYTLEVPQGRYTISVSKVTTEGLEQKAEENITVAEQGNYNRDLILFEELQEFEEPPIHGLPEQAQRISPLIAVALFLVGIGAIIYLGVSVKRRLEAGVPGLEEDDLEAQILARLRKEKRTTQKELRRQFPYAEATISLALSSLEHQGKIEKIRKGRSNIIMLKKER